MFKRLREWIRHKRLGTRKHKRIRDRWHIVKRAEFFGLQKTAQMEWQNRYDEPQVTSEQRWLVEEKDREKRVQARDRIYQSERVVCEANVHERLKALDDETTARFFEESLNKPEQEWVPPKGVFVEYLESERPKRLPPYEPYRFHQKRKGFFSRKMIATVIFALLLALGAVANAELLVYGTVDRQDDETLVGDSQGKTYFDYIGERIESGELLERRIPILGTEVHLSRGTNLRHSQTASFDIDRNDAGFAKVRFTASNPDEKIVGFGFNILTFANLEMTELDFDGMIDIHVNQRPILWGHTIRGYRVIETDPDNPITQFSLEGSGVSNRINFFDLFYTSGQPIHSPEPASAALFLIGVMILVGRPMRRVG